MLLMQSELQSSSQEMNGACRGRRADSGEKYTLLSQTFILLLFSLLNCSPSGRVKGGTFILLRVKAKHRREPCQHI